MYGMNQINCRVPLREHPPLESADTYLFTHDKDVAQVWSRSRFKFAQDFSAIPLHGINHTRTPSQETKSGPTQGRITAIHVSGI